MNHTGKVRQILYSAAVMLVALLMLSTVKIDAYATEVRVKNVADVEKYIDCYSANFSLEADYLREWFSVNGYGLHNIANPQKLYATDDIFVGLYFDIDNEG